MDEDDCNYGIIVKDEEDENLRNEMTATGLPTGFYGNMRLTGGRRNYYCNICKTELNSEDTRVSHIKGSKHLKKIQEVKDRTPHLEGGETSYVVEVKPPPKTIKKIPKRLREKLRDTDEIVVGLRYIQETVAINDPSMEPQYKCSICKMQSEANGMFNHVTGKNHKQNFLQRMFPNDPKYLEMRSGDFVPQLQRFSDKTEQYEFTDYTVDRYQWPQDKAPWLQINGGTGQTPSITNLKDIKGGLKDEEGDNDVKLNRSNLDRINIIKKHVEELIRNSAKNRHDISLLCNMITTNVEMLEELLIISSNKKRDK